MNNFLEIKSLKAWYGASQALFDVNLDIKEGKLLLYLVEMEWGNPPLSNQSVV